MRWRVIMPGSRAEYLAQFRSDVETFITIETVRACVDVGVRERSARVSCLVQSPLSIRPAGLAATHDVRRGSP